MIKIGNIRTFKSDGSVEIHVDRRSALGNPFIMKDEDQRIIICNKYEKWFNQKLRDSNDDYFKKELLKIYNVALEKDVTLLCWCYPNRCHAETIKRYLDDSLLKGGLL